MNQKIAFFCSIPFIGLCLGYAVVWYVNRPKLIICPSLVGISVFKGLVDSADAKVIMHIRNIVKQDTLPEGTIIQQIPHAGTLIKQGQTIYVTVSVKATRTIPALKGKNVTNITFLDAQKEYNLNICHLPSCYPEGTIFAQNPIAEKIADKTPIILYVSAKQANYYIFPQLCGHTLSEIKEFLDFNQVPYTVDLKTDRFNPIVIAQQPQAGSIITIKDIKMVYIQCA